MSDMNKAGLVPDEHCYWDRLMAGFTTNNLHCVLQGDWQSSQPRKMDMRTENEKYRHTHKHK